MKKIGILSDTHCTLIPQLFDFFKDVDELWHAGDIGNIETAEALANFKPLRAVHGNIDDHTVRLQYPEDLFFHVEDVNVYMTHIGGYPGHWPRDVYRSLLANPPRLFVCGHSHICKAVYDHTLGVLVLNPGAAGTYGQQVQRTLMRFELDAGQVQNLEVIELAGKY